MSRWMSWSCCIPVRKATNLVTFALTHACKLFLCTYASMHYDTCRKFSRTNIATNAYIKELAVRILYKRQDLHGALH